MPAWSAPDTVDHVLVVDSFEVDFGEMLERDTTWIFDSLGIGFESRLGADELFTWYMVASKSRSCAQLDSIRVSGMAEVAKGDPWKRWPPSNYDFHLYCSPQGFVVVDEVIRNKNSNEYTHSATIFLEDRFFKILFAGSINMNGMDRSAYIDSVVLTCVASIRRVDRASVVPWDPVR